MKSLKFTTLVTFIFLFASYLNAEENNASKLPKLLGSNTAGKEFYFTFIPSWEIYGESKLIIYVSSSFTTKVTVEVKGKSFLEVKYTVPNDIIAFELPFSIGQAYRKDDMEVPEPDQVWRACGVHVFSDAPIICYGVSKAKYTSDAFLALPVDKLGKQYIVASYADAATDQNQWLPSYTGITAAYDKTKVRFVMGGTDFSKTAGGLTPGQTSYWNLDAGDVLLVASLGAHSELTGSTIDANKPVSVVSGNFCAYIPTNCGCCDVIEEMELPTEYWGKTYHVTPIFERKKNSMIKIFAKEAKTNVFRDNESIGDIRMPGGLEGIGYLSLRADEGDARPIVITGDKPINVTQFNTGQQDDNVPSDPFQMVLFPIELYQTEIIFCTPGIKGSFGYLKNYINIVYEPNKKDSIPDDLQFAMVDSGKFVWQKINEFSPNPGKPFYKNDSSLQYYSKTILLPGDGVYKLKADKPFQAYSYGFSSYDSYGMPASANIYTDIIEDIMPPEPKWSLDCDGNVNVKKSQLVTDKPDDPKSRSNLSTIYMHSNQSYNYKLSYGDFMPCDDASTAWKLEVVDPLEDAHAVVTFGDCAGNDTTLDIKYYAAKLRVHPHNLDFGFLSVGDTVEMFSIIENWSDSAPIVLHDLKLKMKDVMSQDMGFSVWDSTGKDTVTLPKFLAPGENLKILVRFIASEQGVFKDSLGFGDTCNFSYRSEFKATVGHPVINVSDISFDTTDVGSFSTGELKIKNEGDYNLEITGYKGPNIKTKKKIGYIFDSHQLTIMHISPSNKMVLLPNETRTFEVTFAPEDTVLYNDSIVFTSNTMKNDTLSYYPDSICKLNGKGFIFVSVKDFDKNGIDIFPNPASDKIYVETGLRPVSTIQIIDIFGQIRYNEKSNENGTKIIDISNFENGLYFVKIVSGNDVVIRKVVIQK